jgi:hypothetical protein
MSSIRHFLPLLPLVFLSGIASARVARLPVATDYVLQCSGCHGLQGHGLASNGIPDLREAWRYASSATGRRYLVSVPGVATSRLSDAEAAALLNWVLTKFCSDALSAGFKQFTAVDIAAGRRAIATDAPRQRLQLLGR